MPRFSSTAGDGTIVVTAADSTARAATTKTFLMFDPDESFRRGAESVQAFLFHHAQRALRPLRPLRALRALREVLEVFEILEIRGSQSERMTDGAFSLSPPGSFPLSADPAFQDEVRSELECAARARARLCCRPSVAGVLLTGSFARGEGTVIPQSLRARAGGLSDVECLVVVRNGVVSNQEIHRSMRQVERDTNSDCANSARGIKVELRAIFTEGMLRLRPTIFTRELCEHAKLLWGDPAEIPLPPVPSSGEAISKYDAFRLLNNRIIEQIAVRSEYADRN